MLIREYTPGDFDALRRLHAAQGFGYPMPDLDSPLFVTKLVLEEEEAPSTARKELADGREAADCESRAAERESPFAGAQGKPTTGHRSPVTSHPSAAAASGQADHESRVTNHPSPELRASDSRITMAVLLRLTAETYLLHDPAAGTPRGRWGNFLALHGAALARAAALGLDDAQAFLPPRVARAFGRRLERLGWRRDPWPCFTRVIRG